MYDFVLNSLRFLCLYFFLSRFSIQNQEDTIKIYCSSRPSFPRLWGGVQSPKQSVHHELSLLSQASATFSSSNMGDRLPQVQVFGQRPHSRRPGGPYNMSLQRRVRNGQTLFGNARTNPVSHPRKHVETYSVYRPIPNIWPGQSVPVVVRQIWKDSENGRFSGKTRFSVRVWCWWNRKGL